MPEQYGPAAGTSSRSTKLIHGGLRYLETGQFLLVRQSLAERETLLRIAPLLVRRLELFVPVYRETRRSSWELRLVCRYTPCSAGSGRSTDSDHSGALDGEARAPQPEARSFSPPEMSGRTSERVASSR